MSFLAAVDLRYALRSIRRTPLVSTMIVAILSVCIALVTMLFGVVNGIFLHPLPYPQSESVVSLGPYEALREAVDGLHRTSTQLQQIATLEERELTIKVNREPIFIRGARIDTSFYPVFLTAPILGSLPHPDALRNDEAVLLISERLWKSAFGKRPDIIGTMVELEGKPRRIIGVMPGWFTLPMMSQVWFPFGRDERGPMDYVTGFGRLGPNGSLEAVSREARLVMTRLVNSDSAKYRPVFRYAAMYPRQPMVLRGDRYGGVTILSIIIAGAICVLVAATTNLAALMLARGIRRRSEILIRASLGASRTQLVLHQVAEGLVLGSVSGALGVLLSVWGLRLLLATFPILTWAIPGWAFLGVDWRVLVFASALSLGAIVVFSLWPAIETARVELSGALRSFTDRAVAGHDATRSLHLPVVLQVSLSVILLVVSAILARSAHEYAVGRTMYFKDLYSAGLVSSRPADTTRTTYTQFLRAVSKELENRPGPVKVAATAGYAGLSDKPPLSDFDLVVPETKRFLGDAYDYPGLQIVSDNFFDVMGVPILRGKTFDESDVSGPPTSVVVSRRFAQDVWGSIDVVGKALVLGGHRIRVIGVSENIRQIDVVDGKRTFEGARTVFLSDRQTLSCCNRWHFIVRSERGAADIAPAISSAASSLGLSTAVDVRSFADLSGDRVENIVLATVLGIFAGAAMLFAGIGLYGVVAFTVVSRLREAGIRMALGAPSRDVVRLMMRGAMRLVSTGVLVGLIAAIVVGKMLSQFVIATTGASVAAAALAALFFFTLGGLACYIPARKSGRTDPAMLLRE